MKWLKNQISKSITQFSQINKDKIHEKVKSDKQVKDLVKNDTLTLNGFSYHANLKNVKSNSDVIFNTIAHYTFNDKSLTVFVDGTTDKIQGIKERPVGDPLVPDNGLVIDRYDGPPIDGIRMDLQTPDFTPIPTTGWTAMLVNAAKPGSVSSGVCTPANVPTQYWAQSGIILGQSGPELIWADTTTSCTPQWFDLGGPTGTNDGPISVTAGDYITSEIDIEDDTWIIFAGNIATGDIWFHRQTVSGSVDFQTDTTLTSVFFENPNDVSQNWAPSYSVDPTIDAAFVRLTSSGQLANWQNEVKSDSRCDPGLLTTADYVSGDLTNGLTFDVSDIQSDCAVSHPSPPCTLNPGGDWAIITNCTVASDTSISGSVDIFSGSTLTISNGVTLDVDFANQHILIRDGGALYIENGGKVD